MDARLCAVLPARLRGPARLIFPLHCTAFPRRSSLRSSPQPPLLTHAAPRPGGSLLSSRLASGAPPASPSPSLHRLPSSLLASLLAATASPHPRRRRAPAARFLSSRLASGAPRASPSRFTAPPSLVAPRFAPRRNRLSSPQAAPRPGGSLPELPARLRGPARLAFGFTAPPSLVARRFAPRRIRLSSPQAAPRPGGSLLRVREPAAFAAGAEHGQVPHVGLEPVLGVQRRDQGARGLGGQLGHPATLAADQVHVLRLRREMVAGRAVPEVGVGDQAELLEQLERAVDRGEVHAPRRLVHLGADLLGRGVMQPGDGLQDELALWGNAVAAGPQRGVPRLRHGPESSESPINALASAAGPDIAFWITRERRWSNSMHRCRTREVAVR